MEPWVVSIEVIIPAKDKWEAMHFIASHVTQLGDLLVGRPEMQINVVDAEPVED